MDVGLQKSDRGSTIVMVSLFRRGFLNKREASQVLAPSLLGRRVESLFSSPLPGIFSGIFV